MCITRLAKSTLITAAVAAVLATSAGAGSATARLVSPYHTNTVNVSVSFNSQTPMTETNDRAVAAIQKMGRKLIYKMAREECETLRNTIAQSCQLTNLNVTSQLRHQHNRPNSLYINGSAQFSITLKSEAAE
ncbi:MAG: hypothetical protein AAGF81_20650 [Pseudomonadota bacterium]